MADTEVVRRKIRETLDELHRLQFRYRELGGPDLAAIDYRACWMTLHGDLIAAMARANPPDGLAALQAVVKRMEAIEFPR